MRSLCGEDLRARCARAVAASLLVAAVGALAALGCSTEADTLRPVAYTRTAKSNYEAGLTALRRHRYLEASKLFTYVKTKFPYSQFARFAEVRLADTMLAEEKFAEAIDAYKLFVKLRPTNRFVPYARYRIGEAYYRRMPTDWFLVPPSYEKDQSGVLDAVRAFEEYLRLHPADAFAGKAKEYLGKCKRRLADHEFYVGRFYFRRKKYRAAVNRFEALLKGYSGLGLDRESMVLLVASYVHLDETAKACAAAAELRKSFPASSEAKKAAALLRRPCDGD
jgi:outer membrane protein assembly factor BamD